MELQTQKEALEEMLSLLDGLIESALHLAHKQQASDPELADTVRQYYEYVKQRRLVREELAEVLKHMAPVPQEGQEPSTWGGFY